MNRELLERVAKGEITVEEAQQEAVAAAIKFKVSPKGAVSIYGLQQFPVTLYKDQWRTLLNSGKSLLTFIEENEGVLINKR